MSHTFLLEIGLEEMPAHVVTASAKQLVERVTKFLRTEHLNFEKIESFSTPRRLAVKVAGLADKQPDVEEEVKGPSKKVAQQADGSWSKAAVGFTRGQKLTPDDIFFQELKGTEYAYVKKFIPGQTTSKILPKIKNVVTAMNFPTMMRWGNHDFKYVRPIRWLVALLDQQVMPFAILNIKSDRVSEGHRFLGQSVKLSSATDYPAALEKVFVIADAAKRKELIKQQIIKLAAARHWQIVVEPELLEEVNNLVEYPTVFAGKFAAKYLEIPEEVLITSMRDHQRFFYVRDQQGKLLPNFVSVRNGNQDHLENVIAGNEKVLTARLEDAAFFYHEDQKATIADYTKKLQKVMFHDKIGTIAEKMQRVGKLTADLATQFGFDQQEKQQVARAAEIYKFDLVTGMVGEFAELQGVMGEKYALLQGEDPAVATAIREHYLPIEAGGVLPESKVGALLALADKLDSISSFFAVGMIPSGSNDPYALRRQAAGLVRIALAFDWPVSITSLEELVAKMAQANRDLYQKNQPAHLDEMTAFLKDRIQQQLARNNYDFDVIQATVADAKNPFTMISQAAAILQTHRTDADFKGTIEAASRVLRLLRKAGIKSDQSVDPALFENASEQQLQTAVEALTATKDLKELYQQLQTLRQPITEYFDQTMVMAQEKKLRQNRLAQLAQLANILQPFGDLTVLNVK
ncbi:glycine--tRNA ligase subunit beta [Liquorilactobacillus sicerae]|uniref:glycine--tRNA ligase subunit beta n=1 Tax=Liquorilactobacillus sicerae TaxID=1416943 RepID=UPI0024816BD0|nr:glycine--tRNA ligase subunit beta [Liquorilactobacillus sicerae]